MRPDIENNKTLMAELELEPKLRKEKERYELLKSELELEKYVAFLELEKYKRDNFNLNEKMGRLEEDINILRVRELKDQEKIKGLLDDIERKEKEFKDKFVELKVERRGLECGMRRAMNEASEWKKKSAEFEAKVSMLGDEIRKLSVENRDLACAKKRVENEAHEWKNKNKELEARESRLVNKEISQLKEEEKEGAESNMSKSLLKRPTSEELPKQSADSLQRRNSVPKTEHLVVADSDIDIEDDGITLSQKRSKLTKLADGPPRKQVIGVQPGKVGKSGAKSTCNKATKVSDMHILSVTGNKAHKVAGTTESRPHKSQRKPYSGRLASSDQQDRAVKKAKVLQSNLKSCHPSFIKSMAISHVFGSFYLSLPRDFCKENLPTDKLEMVLEDEKGSEYEVVYLGSDKASLSGGWMRFSLTHHLEFGDALIFELCEPTKFKVYIVRANLESSEEPADRISEGASVVRIQSEEQDVAL